MSNRTHPPHPYCYVDEDEAAWTAYEARVVDLDEARRIESMRQAHEAALNQPPPLPWIIRWMLLQAS